MTAGVLGEPRGWRIPDTAACLRCRRYGGDHHNCWRDVCAERTGEHRYEIRGEAGTATLVRRHVGPNGQDDLWAVRAPWQ